MRLWGRHPRSFDCINAKDQKYSGWRLNSYACCCDSCPLFYFATAAVIPLELRDSFTNLGGDHPKRSHDSATNSRQVDD
jgi:hypothetical protein